MGVKAVVLGAGDGTRMKASLPKVIHRVAGRPMIGWVLDAVASLEPEQTVVVIKPHADQVRAAMPGGVTPVVQSKQLGTAHALEVALEVMDLDPGDHVLVVPADTPLITSETLGRMVALHRRTGSAVTCITANMDDPTGYGRVVRDGWDRVQRIVEHVDTTTREREIKEINGGIYLFDGEYILDAIDRVERDNAQGEYYLPDVVAILGAGGHGISAYRTDPEELSGVNTQDQLAQVTDIMRSRINRAWMQSGVWMQDPDRVYIDAAVTLEAEVRLYAGVHLEGDTTVGKGAEIGPDTYISDSRVGKNAKVWYSVVRGTSIGDNVEVGPYASLRPGTDLRQEAKAGTFVEIKNSVVGRAAKVPHLAYVGDAEVGDQANIGAGAITANYNGFEKHRTRIGSRAQVGSNTVLVAPVEVGEDAYLGAGSVITKNVSDGALGIERAVQREVPGYSERRRSRQEAR